MLLKTWDARVTFKKVDYHNETRFWEKLGEQIGHDNRVTGFTVGLRLSAGLLGLGGCFTLDVH